MYGLTSFPSVPKAFLVDHEAWEAYVASIWHDIIENYDLGRKDLIIEVAPGASSKIGFALKSASFEGTIYLVDPLKSALEAVTEKYRLLLPHATIYPICASLQKALHFLPQEPDFILANHPLDDMLLTTLSEDITPDLFECTSPKHQNCCQRLQSHPHPAISSVVADWKNAFEQLLPKTTILCQYPSLIHKQNGIHCLNEAAREILNCLERFYKGQLESKEVLQNLLNSHENFNDIHIGTEVLNAKNWLILHSL